MNLKQFVPQSVCLQCEGCCRFQTADSLWRPKWDQRPFIDDDDYVKTVVDCGKHLCRFLNPGNGKCGVYSQRPFECVLYPFVLARSREGVKVYVHLACPYVQDHQGEVLQEYAAYLRGLFTTEKGSDFLKRHQRLIADYASVEAELLHLFTIADAVYG